MAWAFDSPQADDDVSLISTGPTNIDPPVAANGISAKFISVFCLTIMRVVLFEDPAVVDLGPFSLARPVYSLIVGGRRLLDSVRTISDDVCATVRPHLQAIQAMDDALHAPPTDATKCLLVNSRLVPTSKNLQVLQEMTRSGGLWLADTDDHIAAVVISLNENYRTWETNSYRQFHQRCLEEARIESDAAVVIRWPHELVRLHLNLFSEQLRQRILAGGFRQIGDGVYAAANAKIDGNATVDTTCGPVVLDEHAHIGPFAFVKGPVFVGRDSQINEHASIKYKVHIGENCKVGGEVVESVIDSFSNKQHCGFVGHSYLGQWVNIGAGTSNSDLKNTYGPVRVEYNKQKIETGMQFLGSMIGDFTKTAVNTSIFTGKVIGACSMLYGYVSTNVPNFCNYARSFGQVTELPASVQIATQRRVLQRRGKELRPVDEQLFEDMYEIARDERQLSKEPLTL